MSHQGPPPPPPSGKMPPPPPPIKGKAPPPPPGGKAAAVKTLSAMSSDERMAWVKSKDGLDLNSLTLQTYPGENYLLSHGFSENKRGQEFTKEEEQVKKGLEQQMQAELTKLLEELFALDDSLKLPVLKNIEAKYNNWKPKRSKDGLNFAYQFLDQEAQKWRQTLAKSQTDISPEDPFYPIFEANRRIADEMHHHYAELFAVYLALPEGEEKESKVSALREIVEQLQKRRGEIKKVDKALDASRKALIAAEKIKQDRVLDLRTKIAQLQEQTAKLQKSREANQFTDEINVNLLKIQELNQLLENPPLDVAQRENDAIQKAKATLQKVELDDKRSKLLQSFFEPPASWQDLSKKTSKAISSPKGKGRDTKGMVKDTQSPFAFEFDIQFLPMPSIKNLARFFAENSQEYVHFLEDKAGLFALMTKINDLTRMNNDMNFDLLMDIAEGKLKRKQGEYTAGKDILKNIEKDEGVKPNYEALLARSNRYHNAREAKDSAEETSESSFNENTFKKYAQDRGITVSSYTPPEGKKSQKYYHYHRSIDLSYLSPAQFLNLANFFARKEGEFLTGGLADNAKLLPYINNLFDFSGLNFEDIVDIASGHLVRNHHKFADVDPRYALTLDVERKGNVPNYESFVAQRKAFIEEKKRLEKEAREAEQKRQLDEQQKVRAEKSGVAMQKLDAMTEDYKRIYKMTVLNLEDPEQHEAYLHYITGRLGKESDVEIKALIREKIGLEGAMLSEPSSLSQSMDSSTESQESSPRQSTMKVPEPLPSAAESIPLAPATPVLSPATPQKAEPLAPSETQIQEASDHLHRVALEVEREGGFVKSTTPLPEGKKTTGLGLKKAGVVGMMRENHPSVYGPKLVKNRKDEDGRKMEALYHAINFLRSPDMVNMDELVSKAHRSQVMISSFDPVDTIELEQLQELAMLLNFDDKLVDEDPRKFQVLLHAAHQKQNLVEFRWLVKLKDKRDLCAFIDKINDTAKQNPLYKLSILKGYLYTLQEKIHEKYHNNPLKYKMGALCQHLLDAIDQVTKANVSAQEQPFMKDFLSPKQVKAEYEKFLIDYNLHKGEDHKKQKGAKPARH